MWDLRETVARMMKEFPSGSQLEKESEDVILVVRLVDLSRTVSWYLTEYDAINGIAYWYMRGLFNNEWWSISITELEKLTVPLHSKIKRNVGTLAMVKIDLDFQPACFTSFPFYKSDSL